MVLEHCRDRALQWDLRRGLSLIRALLCRRGVHLRLCVVIAVIIRRLLVRLLLVGIWVVSRERMVRLIWLVGWVARVRHVSVATQVAWLLVIRVLRCLGV